MIAKAATATLLLGDERTPAQKDMGAGPAAQDSPGDQGPTHGGPKRPAMANDKPRRTINRLRVSVAALLLAAAAGGGYLYWDNARRYETTDDAFIASRQFSVAPKVSGYITAVPVTDNQHVVAGQVIARIDDRDYRTALAQAEAQVAAARASIANIDAQIEVQKAQVDADPGAGRSRTRPASPLPTCRRSAIDMLARENAIALQTAQQNDTALLQQQAGLDTAKAGVTAAQRQIAALEAQRGTAQANLANAIAQRDQARLNLSYTIDHRGAGRPRRPIFPAAVGQYVRPAPPSAGSFRRGHLGERQFQGDPARSHAAGRGGDGCTSTPIPNAHFAAMSPASRPARGPPSRCFRPRTRPETTSRSSSACR